MHNQNDTGFKTCRFLNDDYFSTIRETFVEAFSDYLIPFALTPEQFRNHINLNAVDLERSAGCFEGDRMIGFSLTGFGEWQGKQTAYDAGTGVVPDKRREGISTRMFEMMTRSYKNAGIEQFLLEVISTNTAAVNLYERMGFRATRDLALLQCDDTNIAAKTPPQGIEIREIDDLDWDLVSNYWDGAPSWQNSIEAVIRSRKIKRIFGAFAGGKCVGYVVSSPSFGRIAHLAVSPDHRGRGIGKSLIARVRSETKPEYPLQVINLDKRITSSMKFFAGLGFREHLVQHEMIMPLDPAT
jgi:ribosomal protein S18 acetylase RimI-like enzyme